MMRAAGYQIGDLAEEPKIVPFGTPHESVFLKKRNDDSQDVTVRIDRISIALRVIGAALTLEIYVSATKSILYLFKHVLVARLDFYVEVQLDECAAFFVVGRFDKDIETPLTVGETDDIIRRDSRFCPSPAKRGTMTQLTSHNCFLFHVML